MEVIFDANGAVRELVVCCDAMEKRIMKKLSDDGNQDDVFLLDKDSIIYNKAFINYCPWCGEKIETTKLKHQKMKMINFQRKFQTSSSEH